MDEEDGPFTDQLQQNPKDTTADPAATLAHGFSTCDTKGEDRKRSTRPKLGIKRHRFCLTALSFHGMGEAELVLSGQRAFQHPALLTCTSRKQGAGALPSCPEGFTPMFF